MRAKMYCGTLDSMLEPKETISDETREIQMKPAVHQLIVIYQSKFLSFDKYTMVR